MAFISDVVDKSLRGLVKLKNQKIREKLGLVRHDQPTPQSNFLFIFGNIWKHKNNTQKNTEKAQGLAHPPTSEFFSDF